MEMNLDEAIIAHTEWRLKVVSYVLSPDRSLSASVAESPNECELGKWIKSEGKKYSNLPEFATLVSSHTSFHKAAAEVIKRADAGKLVTEVIVRGAKSEFAAASSTVLRSLLAMKFQL
jgi:Chemoreceptor zinc-binding domain